MRPECEDLKDRLSELVEEELRSEMPAAERERLLLHASQCPECGESLRSYRLLLTALGSLKSIQAPRELTQDILRQIELEGLAQAGPAVKRGPRAPHRAWALGLAATVAIAGGVWLLAGRHFREESLEDRSLELARSPIRSLESGAEAERIKQPEPVVFRLSVGDEEEAESVVQLARLFGASLERDALRKNTARQFTIAFDIDEARLPHLKEGLQGLRPRLSDGAPGASGTRALERPKAPAAAAERAAEGKLAFEELEEADALKQEAAEPARPGRGAAPARRQVVIIIDLP